MYTSPPAYAATAKHEDAILLAEMFVRTVLDPADEDTPTPPWAHVADKLIQNIRDTFEALHQAHPLPPLPSPPATESHP